MKTCSYCYVYNYGLKNFVPLLRSFIVNVLKCKAHFKAKFKFMYITMCSLVTSLVSHDYIKTEID